MEKDLEHSSAMRRIDEKPARILAVDDDRTMLMILSQKLEEQGYEVLTAKNGKEACAILAKEHSNIDALLLDREMPEMNGMQVVKWMKKNPDYNKIPIIMQTGSDKPEQIKEGIDAGVFYYLTKPIEDEVLRSVLTAAIREVKQQKTLESEMKKHGNSFKLMDNSKYNLNSLEEAEDLACFLANCFPDPEATLPGLAELIINALEHGNLGVSYDEKTGLVDNGTWRDELIKRAALPANKNKKVQVFYKKNKEAHMIKIIDEGNGFDWRKFMHVDPSRATDNHGRGIAQANMLSFDRIKYNDKGNEVIATILSSGDSEQLKW